MTNKYNHHKKEMTPLSQTIEFEFDEDHVASPVSIGMQERIAMYDMDLSQTVNEKKPNNNVNHKTMRANMVRQNMFRKADLRTELSSNMNSAVCTRRKPILKSVDTFRNQKLVRPITNATILSQPSTQQSHRRKYGKSKSTFHVVTRDGHKMSGDRFAKSRLDREMKVKSNRIRVAEKTQRSKTPNPRRVTTSRNMVVRTPTLVKNRPLPPSKNEHLRLMMRLDKALSTTTDQPHLYVKRAIAGFHLYHYRKAIRDCHQALSLDYQLPLKLACYYILSMSFHRLCLYSEAKIYHKRALAIVEDPEACREAFSTKQFFTIENIYNNAGLTYFVMDAWAKALDHFNVAQRLAQQNLHKEHDDDANQRIRLYLYNRGTIFFYTHEHTKAIRVLTHALTLVQKAGIWQKLFEGGQVSDADRSIVVDCLYMRHAAYRAAFETTHASHDRHCLKQLLGSSISFPSICYAKYIPQSLWVHMLSFLDWDDLTRVAYTCKFLKTIAYELSAVHTINFDHYVNARHRIPSSNDILQSTATATVEHNAMLNLSGICASARCATLRGADFTNVPLTLTPGPFCLSTTVCQLSNLVHLSLDGSSFSPSDHFSILEKVGQSCPSLRELSLSNFSFPSTSNYLFVHFPNLRSLSLFLCHLDYDFYSDLAYHVRSLQSLSLKGIMMHDDDLMLFASRRKALLAVNKSLSIVDD